MKLIKVITVILVSTIKFLFAPLTSFQMGLTFWETFLYTSLGGVLSVSVFFWGSNYFMQRAAAKRALKRAQCKAKPVKNFTRLNKAIVKVKRTFGIKGLVVITPVPLSLPIGSIICAKFFHQHKRKTYIYLCISTVIWAFFLTSIFSYTS